ncbi:MAG: hypothetical protein JKY69_06630 [Flavobacteriaceae bacterium]|nr:hypothetical protein [Flavobacteriaceae bacterium]
MSEFQNTLKAFLEQLREVNGFTDNESGKKASASIELKSRWDELLNTPCKTRDDFAALMRAEDAVS